MTRSNHSQAPGIIGGNVIILGDHRPTSKWRQGAKVRDTSGKLKKNLSPFSLTANVIFVSQFIIILQLFYFYPLLHSRSFIFLLFSISLFTHIPGT